MAHIDIFNSDAFSLASMSTAVRKLPHVPTFLGDLGLFEPEGVDTSLVGIEQVGQTLQLIPTSKRGSPIPMGSNDKRSMRYFEVPRVAKGDKLYAAEIERVRAFGTTSELESMVMKIAQKQAKLDRERQLTMEYHRMGAINGILYDSNGVDVLYNYFTEFGIAQPAEIDFDLDAASPSEGVLRSLIANSVVRPIIRALGEVPGVQIIGLCGDTFYDQFVNHNDVRVTFKNWEAASALRESQAFKSFDFAGASWVNYRGTDDNSTVAVGATKVKFIVKGVPGLYRRFNAPGEDFETVNTIGEEVYSMVVVDRDRNMWAQPEVYSYPLHMCTRPEVLLRGKNT